jgi:shikimate kinase
MDTFLTCSKNIFLIGFMGSGKSSVGRRLAQKSGRYFLDVDALIEASEGRTIPTIFKEDGESYFRELEKKSAQWMATCVRGSVIATGGGMPLVVQELQRMGQVLYLKLPFEKILERISPQEREKRPLFHNLTEAKRLFEMREAIYESQADLILNADRTIEEIVNEALLWLGDTAHQQAHGSTT